MNEGLKLLKDLGAQKINERTHIPKVPLQALLEEDFQGLNKIQFLGFISILEREYGVELDSFKDAGLLAISEKVAAQKSRDTYVVPQNNSLKIIYFFIAIVILIGAIYYTAFYSLKEEVKSEVIDNTIIESVQKNIIPLAVEPVIELNNTAVTADINASSIDNNLTDSNETNITAALEEVVAKPVVKNTLVVNLKNRRWFGYIDLSTHKKKSKTFSGKLELDTDKNWLFISRPGKIEVKMNSEKKKYSSSKNMRFKYIDGKLTKIKLEEWRRLNKGRTW